MTSTPRIYVACLASYNNGHLHGVWIDCDKSEEEIWEEIETMLKNSPMSDAEEWKILDYENWEGIKIDEVKSLEEVVELAELLLEHGKAIAVYYNYVGGKEYFSEEDFEEKYQGVYESEEDFVYQMWEQDGKINQLEKLGVIEWYINWENIAEDWFRDDFYSVETSYREVYVFLNT